MAVTKRSVALDDDVAREVERAAGAEGVSFSAWLNDAAQERLLLLEGLRGVVAWEQQAGALTPEERAAGEVLLERLLVAAQSRGDDV